MIVCRTLSELRDWRLGRSGIGFVPTMGALHAGHAALIARSAANCTETVVSIFVNPTQFAPHEDLSRYPRPLDADLRICEANGATAVFLPSVETMYGNPSAVVRVVGPTKDFEGAIRPHHFEGVATIVAKLFNIVTPDDVFFGQKDLQQCAVIRNLIDSLCYPIRFHVADTVRESDGLAMSSRNAYLSPEARKTAPYLHAELQIASKRLREQPPRDFSALESVLNESKSSLESHGFAVQYLAMIDPLSFEATLETNGSHLIVAAVLDGVRLIDNVRVDRDPNEIS